MKKQRKAWNKGLKGDEYKKHYPNGFKFKPFPKGHKINSGKIKMEIKKPINLLLQDLIKMSKSKIYLDTFDDVTLLIDEEFVKRHNFKIKINEGGYAIPVN